MRESLERHEEMRKAAEEGGYRFNPDKTLTVMLVEGLLTNEKRYGYPSCPCRLATENAAGDRDMVCPCDYRDEDLSEYGQCYCGLYVTEEFIKQGRKAKHIPERRGAPKAGKAVKPQMPKMQDDIPVWRCSVCGYLCARHGPPEKCPICKAKADRFVSFKLN